jgi:hypothetical protein
MKWPGFASVLAVGVVVSGCVFHKHKTPAAAPATAAASVIVTPDTSLAGKVVVYNDTGRYVVLNFPVGPVPIVGQTLFIYRNGLKVAQVKTDTWRRDSYVVADLVSGEARPGDEVRDR